MALYRKDTEVDKIEDLYWFVGHVRSAELAKLSLIMIDSPKTASMLMWSRDNVLRLLKFEQTGDDETWWHSSPLTVPLDTVRLLIENENISEWKTVTNNFNKVLTVWPPSKKFAETIQKETSWNNKVKSLIADFSVT